MSGRRSNRKTGKTKKKIAIQRVKKESGFKKSRLSGKPAGTEKHLKTGENEKGSQVLSKFDWGEVRIVGHAGTKGIAERRTGTTKRQGIGDRRWGLMRLKKGEKCGQRSGKNNHRDADLPPKPGTEKQSGQRI